jgi:hypothetical protein
MDAAIFNNCPCLSTRSPRRLRWQVLLLWPRSLQREQIIGDSSDCNSLLFRMRTVFGLPTVSDQGLWYS